MSTSSGDVVAPRAISPNQSTTIDIPRMRECCQESRLAPPCFVPNLRCRGWECKRGHEARRRGAAVESIVGILQPGSCLSFSCEYSSSYTNHGALFIPFCPYFPASLHLLFLLTHPCHESHVPPLSPHGLRALRFTAAGSHNTTISHFPIMRRT